MKLIKEARAAVKATIENYSGKLVEAIKVELEKLSVDKITFSPIQLADGEHCDYINHLNKDGSLIIYNNEDCDPSGLAHDDANILNADNWEVEELCRVLEELISFNEKNPKPKMVQQVIPPAQMNIVQRALNLLEAALADIPEDERGKSEHMEYTLFDIKTLRGLLKGEVSVIHTKEVADKFSHIHGVDWPVYTKEFPRKDL